MNVVFSGLVKVNGGLQGAQAYLPAFKASSQGIHIAFETSVLGQVARQRISVSIKLCLPLWATFCFLTKLIGPRICTGCNGRDENAKIWKQFDHTLMHDVRRYDACAYEGKFSAPVLL